MGSDGLWDAISNERAARIARGKPAPEAARHLVKVRATSRQEGKPTVTTEHLGCLM
jgi:serine/threonine protein phosphatase PrpC